MLHLKYLKPNAKYIDPKYSFYYCLQNPQWRAFWNLWFTKTVPVLWIVLHAEVLESAIFGSEVYHSTARTPTACNGTRKRHL